MCNCVYFVDLEVYRIYGPGVWVQCTRSLDEALIFIKSAIQEEEEEN